MLKDKKGDAPKENINAKFTENLSSEDFIRPAPEQVSSLSKMGQEYQDQFKLNFYFPGKSEHQPHKSDTFRYCYTFFKKMGNRGVKDIGDKFDYFLFKAD